MLSHIGSASSLFPTILYEPGTALQTAPCEDNLLRLLRKKGSRPGIGLFIANSAMPKERSLIHACSISYFRSQKRCCAMASKNCCAKFALFAAKTTPAKLLFFEA